MSVASRHTLASRVSRTHASLPWKALPSHTLSQLAHTRIPNHPLASIPPVGWDLAGLPSLFRTLCLVYFLPWQQSVLLFLPFLSFSRSSTSSRVSPAARFPKQPRERTIRKWWISLRFFFFFFFLSFLFSSREEMRRLLCRSSSMETRNRSPSGPRTTPFSLDGVAVTLFYVADENSTDEPREFWSRTAWKLADEDSGPLVYYIIRAMSNDTPERRSCRSGFLCTQSGETRVSRSFLRLLGWSYELRLRRSGCASR